MKILKEKTFVDSIDRVRAQWKAVRPDLDTAPLDIIGRILRIEFLSQARMRAVFRKYGLDRGGFDVLATLLRSGPPHRMTPTALYKALVLTSGAMTNRLDVLERAGLVARLPDPADRRGALIELTPAGRAAIDQAIEAHLQGEAALIAPLPQADRDNLGELLRKLLTAMENEHEHQ